MTVVGAASVFIALQRIDALSLLPQLFGEAPAWIVRHQVAHVIDSDRLLASLDAGEAEAIQLAQTLRAELRLIDEAAGRRVAVRLGLKVTGVVGVLIEARRRGEIQQLRPYLKKLRAAGFWLNDALIETALRLAGENSTRAGP